MVLRPCGCFFFVMAHRLEYAPQSPRFTGNNVVVIVDVPGCDRLVFKTIIQPRRHRRYATLRLVDIVAEGALLRPLSLFWAGVGASRPDGSGASLMSCCCCTHSEGRLSPGHLVVVAPSRILFTACRYCCWRRPCLSNALFLLLARVTAGCCFSCHECCTACAKALKFHVKQLPAVSLRMRPGEERRMCYPACAKSGQVLGGKVTPGAELTGWA